MTEQFTPEEMVSQMTRLGIPREKAVGYAKMYQSGTSGSTAVEMACSVEPVWPLVLIIPWSALVSENRRFCAKNGAIYMTAEYAEARKKVQKIAREAMLIGEEHAQPAERPLLLHARVWMPDKRIHDAPNYAGGIHNALKKIVFKDDHWIHRATWERAGVDCDRPRADITITPL